VLEEQLYILCSEDEIELGIRLTFSFHVLASNSRKLQQEMAPHNENA